MKTGSETTSKKPLFSVVLPVYNAEHYVAEAVESILNQTLEDFELLIINDGSTDGSLAIIKQYAKRDKRINIISHKNKGISATLNNAISRATTDIIIRMDSDDISAPDRFKKQYDFLVNNPEYSIVACQLMLTDQAGREKNIDPKPVGDQGTKLFLGYGCAPSGATVMFKKSVIEKVGGFAENNLPAEDYGCWARIVATDARVKIYTLPDVLYYYRENNKGISGTRRLEQAKRTIEIGDWFRGEMVKQKRPFISYSSHKDWFEKQKLIQDTAAQETLKTIYYKAQTWFINDLKKQNRAKAWVALVKLKFYTLLTNPKNYKDIFDQPLAHSLPQESQSNSV